MTRRCRARRHRSLRRRLFLLSGGSILVTVVVVSAAYFVVGPEPRYRESFRRIETYTSNRFAEVWDNPVERSKLAEQAAVDLALGVTVLDTAGKELSRHGVACDGREVDVQIRDGDRLLGEVVVCGGVRRRSVPFLLGLLAFAGTLWMATGWLARRMTRPLDGLVKTARAIGEGKLTEPSGLTQARDGELGALGEAMDDMAARIARQMADQRELLAVVSHEIRAPLSRLSVSLETLAEQRADPTTIARMEREIRDMDRLVGDLLASSRLEFRATERRALDAREVLLGAVERAGLDASVVRLDVSYSFSADPTLVARALDNLLENARVHGEGVESVHATLEAEELTFHVDDCGPGFPEHLQEAAFDSFVSGKRGGGSSLGLGLSLVRRIAESHGGRAWVTRREGGGARVSFTVKL